MRQQIVAGNWKMNNTLEDAKSLIQSLVDRLSESQAKVIVCPPFPYLGITRRSLGESSIGVGAQNCHEKDSGAYTGEVSAAMLKPMGVDYVILGHSERREYFNESDELIGLKVLKVMANSMTPIFCCGESLNIRESGAHLDFVKGQITNSLFNLTPEQISSIIIAYEPIWAIGTGKTATSDQAQEMHAELRAHLQKKYGEEVSNQIPILYGGSVKPGNAKEIFGQPDVDGGLVGGASLSPDDFIGIIKAYD